MKIFCDIQIVNRLANANTQSRSQKSTLAIGAGLKDDKQVFLLHFTNTNKSGTKYNLKDNLEQVFCKFVNEGKATIRLKTPPQDICIKCDATQLKGFLTTLKCSLSGEVPKKTLALSNISATSITKKMQPILKLNITSRAQYPTKGFPRTLQTLIISGLKLERFETQIIQLRSLHTLDLSDNCLKVLPRSLGSLSNLTSLSLSGNSLYISKLNEWQWLDEMPIRNSLKTLQLSNNNLSVLPDNIVQLHNIETLRVDNNKLRILPDGMNRMRKLQYLFIQVNKLKFLPQTLFKRKLANVDISSNCFEKKMYIHGGEFKNQISLVELSARTILKYDIKYSPILIPRTMCKYLDRSTECMCSRKIVDVYCSVVTSTIDRLAESVAFDASTADRRMPVKLDICSQKCFEPFAEIPKNE
ncbi:leucine-rich repeat protein 1-like [Ctenocephalides felis]|uniref:leucine-rich repeat protein 1-like n=1 Tax=Ctenocephalides felis TaxID=7515 RepID=UPI000E6E51D2|nr:leucine-rich repeat protein 1-like [Ctenocephalides felis]